MNAEVGDYRIATDGKVFCVQRLIDRTIWPLTHEGPARWKQITEESASEQEQRDVMERLKAKSDPFRWRPV